MSAAAGEALSEARAWLAVDPDPDTRAELEELIASGGTELEERFATRLAFGTAGLRGALGAGPTRMNRVLVRMTAAGVSRRVLAEGGTKIVVAHDARHNSDVFADDTARVAAAHGLNVEIVRGPHPTPVLAFAVRHLGADAGVMVTASHNPRADNGFKVYWGHGAQIASPVDSEIAAEIDAVGLISDADLAEVDDPRITDTEDSLISAYVEAAVGVISSGSARDLAVVYTPVHGVGREVFLRAFAAAGFPEPVVVPEQGDPDPDFPTAAFPNPEEPGVLDLAIDLAAEMGSELVIANDPDADRLAVVVPNGDGWRPLTGNEIGGLLAEHTLSRGDGNDRLVATTVVSSRLLSRIAADHGVVFEETLTGFKWIMRPAIERTELAFTFGFEEALGFAVGDAVRDKDGISAALAFAEMAAEAKAAGTTVLDLLDRLHRRHGVHHSDQRSFRFEGSDASERMSDLMKRMRLRPPVSVGDLEVDSVTDLLATGTGLPATDALILDLSSRTRLVLRPSGTEPKLKLYGETIVGADFDDLTIARESAVETLHRALDAAAELIGGRPPDSTGTLDTVSRQLDHTTSSPSGFSAGSGSGLGLKVTPVDEVAIEARAKAFTTRSIKKASKRAALDLAISCIDLTTLEGMDTPGRVRALCQKAISPDPTNQSVPSAAAVCVYPKMVPHAVANTAGSSVAVASVAGAFPSGLSSLEVRLSDIRDAVAAGAGEIDIVIGRGDFFSGQYGRVFDEIAAAKDACGSAHLKVILETGELGTYDQVRRASMLAMAAGADFIKTSTGKVSKNSTLPIALCMAEAIRDYVDQTGEPVGLKVAGGIRTAKQAWHYLVMVGETLGPDWLDSSRFRIGASSLLNDALLQIQKLETGRYSGPDYVSVD